MSLCCKADDINLATNITSHRHNGHIRMMSRASKRLHEAWFLAGHVAPFLDDGSLLLPENIKNALWTILCSDYTPDLGLVWDRAQTSLGTSTHSWTGASLGTSFVTCEQLLTGSMAHSSTGLSTTIVLILSVHITGPFDGLKKIGYLIDLG